MSLKARNLYNFIGIHTFLIGLFPFYLPVYLWKSGFTIATISLFISFTGVGFFLALWVWDRLHKRVSFQGMVISSFALEIILLALMFFEGIRLYFPILALINGAYGCFFWTTQRVLFLDMVRPAHSGRSFGNLQIVVAVLLKIGIFAGGLLLESFGFTSVFVLSTVVSLVAVALILKDKNPVHLPQQLTAAPALKLIEIFRFKDQHRSRLVFLIDGLFLNLESYFWMISMFIIVNQSFWDLGILVIILMVAFVLLFYLTKNVIDRLPKTTFFRISVCLYAASWLLRSQVSAEHDRTTLALLLISIAFFTSLFRLSFNKRFFDLAKSGISFKYLLYKSYYSQASVAIGFALIGSSMFLAGNSNDLIGYSYIFFALLSLGFGFYGTKKENQVILSNTNPSLSR